MSKSLDNLTIAELLELKTASDMISESYAQELTDYVTMNGDAYFKKADYQTMEKHQKRIKSKELSNKIKSVIERRIEEYYD